MIALRRMMLALLFLAASSPAIHILAQTTDQPPPIESVIVYVKCKALDGKISRGTGVLVSSEGAVLTAKHVVPLGYTCLDEVGTAAARLPARWFGIAERFPWTLFC
jgi:hypothetical protein